MPPAEGFDLAGIQVVEVVEQLLPFVWTQLRDGALFYLTRPILSSGQ